jgi:molybdate transport system ATP-binding protein
MNNQWAIFGLEFSMNSIFLKDLLKGKVSEPLMFLKNKKGALFSTYTLNQFIKDEFIHDDYTLSKNEKRSIRTYSSGEQKKALLDYLLTNDFDFLVLDNVFDMLDSNAQEDLLNKLIEINKTKTIIQIFRRKDELLPFIKNVLSFKNDEIIFSGAVEDFKKQFLETIDFSVETKIPKEICQYTEIENPLIEFKNVSVNYGAKKILNTINWKINQGEFWQLIGPNGSGKTTMLTMIIGDNPKAFGENITIFGRKKGSGESVWELKKKIGYVTPAMTVLFKGRHTVENMVISGIHDSIGLYKPATDTEKRLARQWLDLIGMLDLKDKWFSNLSEEQQCMVLIVRSMIKHPPLLILDEPTKGLSDYNALLLTALINKIAEESKTSIIYVSHKKEKGLKPKNIFELIPSENGSKGIIVK